MNAQTTTRTAPSAASRDDALVVVPFRHPQGCRSYLIADPTSAEALALDVHLDLVGEVAERLAREAWTLRWIVDSHTHADHPSGSATLAARSGATRVAHAEAHHAGVAHHPADGERLDLGERHVTVRLAPGHTPDHVVLVGDGVVFSGDTLLIGGVARTDFLGGDAGTLFDTLQRILGDLDADTVVFPGHDYEGRERTTVGAERASNPWLALERTAFEAALSASPPPRPANMDALLRLNREGLEFPESVSAAEAVELVRSGGAASVVDVRTAAEYEGEHVPGSRHVPLDQLEQRVDEVRATPAPRLLLCRSGARAALARKTLRLLDVSGLTVIEGGIEALARAGGETQKGRAAISLERQVRIGAGALVLLGVALGTLVHPALLAIAAFVGAGLVFAGVTDWCGMGIVLSSAPWNRGSTRTAGAGGAGGSGGTCAAGAPSACAASAPPPPAACAAGAPPGESSR